MCIIESSSQERAKKTSVANRSLDLELSAKDTDDWALMYMHLSSVSVSWDGRFFVVAMRDAWRHDDVASLAEALRLALVLRRELPSMDT